MIISRKIKGMVMKNASGDNGRNQEKNSTRKKNHKQKDKTRDEIVKLMLERLGVRPSNSRSVKDSRALPGLITKRSEQCRPFSPAQVDYRSASCSSLMPQPNEP